MKTVELFAGIGGFRIAADRCGLKTVWANDVCPKASAVYRDQFGLCELKQGDVGALVSAVPDHDVLTGGFPCQPFSSAGKKKGIRDPRGTLFEMIVEVLRSRKPKYFVLENVKRLLAMERGRHFATILSSIAALDYCIEWRLLNAMHFGLPQNRQRVFLVGVRDEGSAKQPLKIRLAPPGDLGELDNDVREALGDKSCWRPIEKHGVCFPNWGLAGNGRFIAADLEDFSLKTDVIPVRTVLDKNVSAEFDFTDITLKWVGGNTPVNRFVQGVEILSNQAGGARMGYTIFGIDGVAPTLTSATSRHYCIGSA